MKFAIGIKITNYGFVDVEAETRQDAVAQVQKMVDNHQDMEILELMQTYNVYKDHSTMQSELANAKAQKE
jgi:hypothetical protein